MKRNIKLIIGMIALAVIMFGQTFTHSVSGAQAPGIVVLSPGGGDVWTKGETNTIRWAVSALPSSGYITLTLNHANSNTVGIIKYIFFSPSEPLSVSSYTWDTRVLTAAGWDSDGTPIPVEDYQTGSYQIRAVVVDYSISPASVVASFNSATFTIVADLRLTISGPVVIPWPYEPGTIQGVIISWTYEPGSVYRVLSSRDLQEWREAYALVVKTNAVAFPVLDNWYEFYRVQKLADDLIIQPRILGHTTFSVDSGNQTLANFDFTASGKDMKVSDLDVAAIVTGEVNGGIRNAKIYVDGVQVGTTKNLPADSVAVNFTFGSSFIIKAGTTAKVRVVGDIKQADGTSYAGGENIIIALHTGSVSVLNMTTLEYLQPKPDLYGDVSYIASSALTVTKYSGFGNQTVVAGANNVRLGSFVVLASAERINGSSVTVTLSQKEAAAVTAMRLVDHNTGATLGVTKVVPGIVNNYFLSPNIVLGANASPVKIIDLYADIMAGIAGIWQAQIDVEGSGVDTGASVLSMPEHQTLQTITIVDHGTLTAAKGVMPDSAILIAGSTGNYVAQYTFRAANEGFTIDRLKLNLPWSFALSTIGVIIKYNNKYGVREQVEEPVIIAGDETKPGVATFTGLTMRWLQNSFN